MQLYRRGLGQLLRHLVTESRDVILKSEFPKAVVLEPLEIGVTGIYSGRALSDVNSSSETGHQYAGRNQEWGVKVDRRG